MFTITHIKRGIALLMILFATGPVMAQNWSKSAAPLQPLTSQYFQNQYISNPAMAGIDTGLHVNVAYRRGWTDMPGAPITQSATADYYVGQRVGAGLNVFNDKAGLINRTKVAVTYAYHLPLNTSGDSRLHFGLSLGINSERLDRTAINGDGSDPAIGAFNRRDNYFEGDYGMAYTNKHLTIQGAIPNVMNLFRPDGEKTIDGSTFYAAASYRFFLNDVIHHIEPKVCFRGVRGYDNLVDIGANIVLLQEYLNVSAIYHSSRNFTLGVGFNYRSVIGLHALYTTQTGGLQNYSNGSFELGLSLHVFK
ncbi:PorP/SprF family type IX secretion system membrane protein [Chitinophaga vietnamensis]|uniref:PorP/SprF family type IX secretion system membrane protein n=1 Tax=Chitinophaga vietnamensis TaxID=2593957 RepID=UPI001177DF23|nr:PorP/SprF family type IX secretion system membrane protein [Chitinophaga vietnamensis]